MAEQSQYTGAIGGAAQGASIGSSFGPYGAVIGGALGGIGGFLSGGGEDDAEKLAEEQARLIESATQENQRVMRSQMAQELGYAQAAVGASNIQFGGSSGRFINALRSESERTMAWERMVGKKQAEAVRAGGQAAAGEIKRAGITNMVGGVGQAGKAGLLGSYNKDDGYSWDPWG